jgi:5-methylcytosine-specific restriction endonuclease McrA
MIGVGRSGVVSAAFGHHHEPWGVQMPNHKLPREVSVTCSDCGAVYQKVTRIAKRFQRCESCRDARKKEYFAKYNSDHREHRNKYSTDWCARFKQRSLATKARYRERNRQKENAAARERYRLTPRSELNAVQREYRKNNPEKHRAHLAKRRRQIKVASDNYTADDVKALYKTQRGKCAEPSCRADLKKTKYHVDHIMPLALGGTNGAENIQLLCPRCNIRKHSKDPYEWAKTNGRLF